jgi:hypothetical protein
MPETTATPALNIAAPSGFVHKCEICRDPIKPEGRADLLKSQDRPLLCLWCGEQMSRVERSSWCVLTPHKQGPMFFTAESAREMALGINNKGGLVR